MLIPVSTSIAVRIGVGLVVEALDVGHVDLDDWLTALLSWMTVGLAFGANADVTPCAVRQMC